MTVFVCYWPSFWWSIESENLHGLDKLSELPVIPTNGFSFIDKTWDASAAAAAVTTSSSCSLSLAQCHLLGDLLTGDSVKMPQKMFSYMYEVNLPKFDINANSVENVPRTAATREKSARDRTKLRRSKSTHCMDKMDIKMRPKSHGFRREKEFYNCYNEVKIIDMEDDNGSNNFSAWCVSFDSEADRVSCEFCPDPAADWISAAEEEDRSCLKNTFSINLRPTII